jgi:zinc transport system ATP-binding protein
MGPGAQRYNAPMSDSSENSAGPILQARNITVSRAGIPILNHVNLSLKAGEIITLVGLNGSGKSTLVKILGGLMQPDEGEVIRRPGLRIGYCPQHAHADTTLPMSVSAFMKLTDASPGTSIHQVLDEVGIGSLQKRQLSELSGGEYQRLLLARAMLRQPDLLLLDEPMAGVDMAGQSDLYQLIPTLRDRYGCGVVLVSHDIHIVMAATDRVICLNHHVCCSGQPETVAVHPEFVSLFGARVADNLAVYKHHHDHSHDLHGHTLGAGHEQGDHSMCDHDDA